MEVIAVEYIPTSIDTRKNEENSEFHSYISNDNEKDVCNSHAHMVHLLKTSLESGRLVSGMSTVWEGTDGGSKQYRCAFVLYLMTVLSYSYGIILDQAIDAPGHGKNVVDGLNATYKRYLKG